MRQAIGQAQLGMLPAETGDEKVTAFDVSPSTAEVAIRALGVSLVAIAAVVASLTIVRQRVDQRPAEPGAAPDDARVAVDLNLEAIRSAGF